MGEVFITRRQEWNALSMEACREERSEQWQEAEKGEAFQEIIDQVDAARTAVEEISLE